MRSLAVKVKMEILKLALKLLSKFYQLLRTFLSHVRMYIYIVMKELFTKIMLGELPWECMIGEELSNFTRERWFLIPKHAQPCDILMTLSLVD